MLKRTVGLLSLLPLVFLALVVVAQPGLAFAVGGGKMAPAPTLKGDTKGGAQDGAKPGMWKDYNPADDSHSQSKMKRRFTSGELVVVAYLVIWAVVFIYVLLLARRQSQLSSELDQLRRRLDEADPPAVAGDSKKT